MLGNTVKITDEKMTIDKNFKESSVLIEDRDVNAAICSKNHLPQMTIIDATLVKNKSSYIIQQLFDFNRVNISFLNLHL